LESKIDKKTKIEGKIKIGKKCQIQKSEIKGPVAIGNNVKIVNSYIGPFSSISDNCEILNSHVENSILMQRVKVLNLKQPINESIIGTETEVVDVNGPADWLKLFVGEKCRLKL
jgi:glucose-1-phosphate thymidylyltransferase